MLNNLPDGHICPVGTVVQVKARQPKPYLSHTPTPTPVLNNGSGNTLLTLFLAVIISLEPLTD